MSILNISAYRFVPLSDLPALRSQFQSFCRQQAFKGTVVLSEEGVNIMLAGSSATIQAFKAFLETFDAFRGMTYKESSSDTLPFKRMLVKVKRALTPFDVPVKVSAETANYLPPAQLKHWLDTQKDMVLLDTRNEYEIEVGTFKTAASLNLKHFCEFTDAIVHLPEALKSQPVVTYCTGGIRCEKIVPFLREKGFKEVYQLEGGILQYFHDCGEAHFEGACYVFDERVSIRKADTL
ncbi:MAG: sulfurtransferase [Gammaproteobacteria bacterium]|nr:sulfurtransferase [Gammaproteobacteria bacterium]